MDDSLLKIEQLSISFRTDHGNFRAVDGISFSVKKGETLGLVGESGCGKSVTAYSILNLLPGKSCQIESAKMELAGGDLLAMNSDQLRAVRGGQIGMVFQDALSSLDPVFTVGAQLCEAILAHQSISKDDALLLGAEMLRKVGIPEPEARLEDYPHQLSGGMRQRVMIAIALVNNPILLIADEPTTALDVTIQAQILELIKKLKTEQQMSVLFITHDLGVIAEIADRVAVMYAGGIVEEGATAQILSEPLHPYTQGLIASIPEIERKIERLRTIPGKVPTLAEMSEIKGCRFAPRCSKKIEICEQEQPLLALMDDSARKCACFVAKKGQRNG